MRRTLIKETVQKIGEDILVKGWVDTRRDHGKLIFIDLIDTSGLLQIVFGSEANQLRPGDVIEVEGKVSERPKNMVNENLETGTIELQAKKLNILNKSETPPFELNTEGYEVNEETRLKYRYLDLRRKRLQNNLKKRHILINFLSNFLTEREFVEIETPLLTKSTPEGARDYVVPSRLHQGKFYALPQAPQQFKQLLMLSGIEKYFQIAKCLRDEDTRADRQPEFTQLDIEISFTDREEVMELNEELIIETVKKIYPDKKIKETPFPRISYKEAMEKYKTDRPDLRQDKNNADELAFCWIIDFPFFAKAAKGESGTKSEWTFTHNPFSAAISEHEEILLQKKDIDKIIASQYDIVLNGFEIGGGSIRNHKPELLKSVLEIIGMSEKEIQENFGHMLEAFKYGAPPHGGIAWGLDRLIAILQNEPSIREVIAFPKTGDGRDLMMNAPSELTPDQLKELGIEIKKEE
ncbi:MAG: aspartate--tRNA ligase [Candidatus Tagabacteria bacterium CG09_land_8_20_14_0_10_41_14]|uniref:Aspartate--tRNA(Asp/Asn) ligase n=2 Tax=Candidatus Tagaibacteriota TaxID=1817918 RepID=A0A2H0WKR6_9BACT|nr:MAG: aspartate--tRNA ligase [Candidatus Tagabacteria bacterium CG09_land_8_20_14_0_10_41_14]PJE72962.1 MAG: aspartate--tRNA ligase [Candidatus Tagabacteria bacterium CG10_big_fil_rev_8_21_14_0_10_40_13]